MNSKNKRKASSPVRRAKDSILLIDAKSELAAVMRGKTKTGGVLAINPFVVLPPEHLENCGRWFRLVCAAALDELQRKDGMHPWNKTE